ncbi:PilC/PilY family type IV pilus protein [Acinetobacter sp. SA01]|uniref:pilus assembly protein n=1 Tax=Acinetobacter sp. SA01 TaxID=1862567 RepID=UPI001F11824B|nr:PilC/PilY family type IV pilus protein [Acinetobacter sp. SA01]
MKKINQRNMLSASVSMMMTLAICHSVSVQASDIEIYKTGFTPNPVVMFALDNSGSMSVNGRRSAFDLKDSMQAVLLGEGSIQPARNIKAGLSTFESPPWYPIKNGSIELYKTTVHPATAEVDSDTTIRVPRRDAGYIASPAQMLDDRIVYPFTRKDLFPSNGDVIFKEGNNQPVKTNGEVTIDADNKKVYIRFQVDVPRGATINSAYLELRNSTDYGSNKLKVRVAKHNDLYAANPQITSLQTFAPGATSKAVVSSVSNDYLTKIFTNATTQRAIDIYKNSYKNDNIGNPMYVYSMSVKSEMENLIRDNTNWCGMGDIIFELSRDNSKNYKFYADREDRMNPHLYIDWTLSDNTIRNNNCMFTDTKRSMAQRITNLGDVGAVGTMLARQSMNLQVQRLLTDTATPSNALYAETVAYMLGNSTKPLTNSSPANTSIDAALSGLTTGFNSTIKYISPIKSVSDYLANSTNINNAAAYLKEQQCGQHGIYFLTDGEAEFNVRGATNTNDNLFASSMGWSSISCNSFDTCAQTMARGLLKASGYTANNRSLKIKTSTVGFNYSGSSLSSWAAAGGGQYTAVNSSGSGGAKQGIVNSISAFLDDIFNTDIPEQVVTGSPTLPQDSLNPLRVQPYGYYAAFTPRPQDSSQLWAGNLNKYHVVSGELYNIAKNTRLINTDGSLNTNAHGIWTNGMRGQLPLGLSTNAKSETVANRTIYTNRQITGTAAPFGVSELNSLKKVNVESLFGTGTTALFANDPDKNYWLNLLGYNVGATETDITLESLATNPELRQVGAVMHSTPILLTQSGEITVSSTGVLDTTNRDDYLLFGSTQGLLHVVDADTGVEKFAFAPHEMMQNQKAAFLSETSSTQGSSNLFYGIDAPWTAYTQYVSKADGTLTVKSSDRTSDGSTNTDLALKGLQWVYGGLRMGGRSYYALDLSDLDKPSLKFHINPDAAVTATGAADTNNALSYMGQSWSKPTIAYVKFGGVKKLVMFVGGGYDSGYESTNYNQSTTTGSGAGVYMFDANTGNLLWWSSANATAAKGAEAYTDASASAINMKYSVVSQINAIDRDNDGLIDNLYFGDLGGQAFRVDINNAATGIDVSAKKGNFVKRVVRLYNAHVSGGLSPRFYEMPSFSVHEGVDGIFGAVALSSGNRSSPLASETNSANDAVYVIYDNDVARNDLYSDITLRTPTSADAGDALDTMILASGVAQKTEATYNRGWKYQYATTPGRYKGMNEIFAVDGILYVNVYDRDGTGIGSTCTGGVNGDSYVYQFCLPTGKCTDNFYATGQTAPNRVKIGGGILGTGLGQGGGNSDLQRLTVNRPTTQDCTTTANKNKPECQQFNTTVKLRQLRWYESR